MIALPPDIAVNIPKFSEAGLEALADVLLDSMESSCPRDMGAMPDHVVVEDDYTRTAGVMPAAGSLDDDDGPRRRQPERGRR